MATQAVDEVRRRVQQDTLGHRGKRDDPLYKIRTILRSGAEDLTLRQQHRLAEALATDQRHEVVYFAWQCAQRVRDVFHAADAATGRALAEKVLAGFPSCPIPEIARLGRTLKQWADAFLGYFRTSGLNNGGTEAVNGLIELRRRIARGFRNREKCRLRMLLIAGATRPAPTSGAKSPFEASAHIAGGAPFGAAADVGLGGNVIAHPRAGDHIDGPVELTIA